ncbi:MAG: lysine exporter LysE/YggA [Modestobacter sp.]|nr:lysine exporter LysE/YggA [Modestobacter sp.]
MPGRGMARTGYRTFLVFAAVLVLVRGPDFAVVVRNALAGGRGRGVYLVFHLAVLPQFLVPGAGLGLLLRYALSHAALGLLYLTGLTLLLSRARRLLSRRAARCGLDAATGVVLLGFGARLALERS